MAIQTPGEFEITLSDLILRVERMLYEQPRHTGLTSARRQLQQLADCARKKQPPSAKQVEEFSTAAETIRRVGGDDGDLADRIYDLMDWLEQNRAPA
jgi:hypothetical protein